jgi:dTDP-glucose pyrophosphorylase
MDADTVRGGLIAAGTGSRFRKAGITTDKPMIRVSQRPLLGWSMLQFEAAGIRDVTVIFNTGNGPACSRYLRRSFTQMDFSITCRDTATSFESFLTVLSSARAGRMLITTVDAIYLPGKIARLMDFAAGLPADAMVLGVTDYIDDEKPLYAALDEHGRITALGGPPCPFVTSGVYFLPCSTARLGENRQFAALRNFLGFLLDQGVPAYGFDMGTAIDVDRPRDLASAEDFIASHY